MSAEECKQHDCNQKGNGCSFKPFKLTKCNILKHIKVSINYFLQSLQSFVFILLKH